MKEVMALCQSLLSHVRAAQDNPELFPKLKDACRGEIELAEIVVSSKYKKSPLATRTLVREAVCGQIPAEARDILSY